ncbi:MAG: nuclear transport factor 2 family protein [Acidimicrobiia bacterium]
MTDSATVVRRLFEAMQQRRWDEAAALLAPDVTVWWPVTDERFQGAKFIEMQEAYPAGWEITVVEVLGIGDRVTARVAVDQDGERFWCHGWYEVSDGHLTDAIELWVTEGSETPPEWRARFAE